MLLTLTIFFCLLLLISFLDVIRIQKEIRPVLVVFICVSLVCFITFRYGVADYDSYVEIFDKVSFNNFFVGEIHGEVGYLLLNIIIKFLGGNAKILFFIVGCLSVFFTIRFYKKYTKYYLLALFIYFSHVFLLREMIQIRSGLAISIVMFSIPYVAQRKFIKFLIVVLIASLFHSICLLFIIIYFLYSYVYSTKKLILLLLLGVILGLVFNTVVIEQILILLKVPPIILDYLLDDNYNYSLGLLNPVLLKMLLVLSILFYNRVYLRKLIPYFDVLLISYTIGAFWLEVFNSFAILSARIATMFSNTEHVLIPSLLLVNKHKSIIYGCIIMYCFYSFFSKWQLLSTWSFNF